MSAFQSLSAQIFSFANLIFQNIIEDGEEREISLIYGTITSENDDCASESTCRVDGRLYTSAWE